MKKIGIILMIISIILMIAGLTGVVDYKKYKEGKLPVFARPLDGYWDGGTNVCYGIGYKIIQCHTLSGDESIHFGTYSMKYPCTNDGKKIIDRR